jgi:hypothetical protein
MDKIEELIEAARETVRLEERRRIVELLISEDVLHPDDEQDQVMMELIFAGEG